MNCNNDEIYRLIEFAVDMYDNDIDINEVLYIIHKAVDLSKEYLDKNFCKENRIALYYSIIMECDFMLGTTGENRVEQVIEALIYSLSNEINHEFDETIMALYAYSLRINYRCLKSKDDNNSVQKAYDLIRDARWKYNLLFIKSDLNNDIEKAKEYYYMFELTTIDLIEACQNANMPKKEALIKKQLNEMRKMYSIKYKAIDE